MMTIDMNDSHIISINQIKEFLKGSAIINFKGVSKREKYLWIENTLNRFKYFSLRKRSKTIVRQYISKMTGYSDSQITRLINKKRKTGKVLLSSAGRHSFPTKYTSGDVDRLVQTDNAHNRLSGPATKKIFIREYKEFNNQDYERLSKISIAHIYNLRKKRQYTSASLTYTKTQATKVSIGERKKPDNKGKPGFIRVDSVHQGDLDKKKGVYHINLVDEVTQWEVVCCVSGISERFLVPVLEDAIKQFPFNIINFHSDNGSEYINKVVAKLLNKLAITQTKSRSRKSNDQALVEGKNGAVIRKHMGRSYIDKKYAIIIDDFYRQFFNVYLNYHRPCGFATNYIDKKGKIRKKYDTYLMPYEKLLLLDKVEQYLKGGITKKDILKKSKEYSDNEFAIMMQKEKKLLFKKFKH